MPGASVRKIEDAEDEEGTDRSQQDSSSDQQDEKVINASGYAAIQRKIAEQRKKAEEKQRQEAPQQQEKKAEDEKKHNSESQSDLSQEQTNDKQAEAKVKAEAEEQAKKEAEAKTRAEAEKAQPKTFDDLLTVKGTKDEDIVFNEGVLDTNGALSFEGKQYLRYDPEHPEATQGKLSYKVGYVTVASY
ncbi:MAG: hypothetical protein Q4B28_06115 [bacterium]|nr:hypothetical protein [bacterium]